MRQALILLTTCAALSATPAWAANKCNAGPKEQWKPQAELEQKLQGQGWKIKRVKVDSGCYEVYGTDKDGKRVEVYFDPKTLEAVK